MYKETKKKKRKKKEYAVREGCARASREPTKLGTALLRNIKNKKEKKKKRKKKEIKYVLYLFSD